MRDSNFLNNYFNKYSKLIKPNKKIIDQLVEIKNLIKVIKRKKSKILIFGNGGSSAIASHFSVDITKNFGIKCLNFNEASFITCFANDYGFDNWITKAIKLYSNKGDLLILISSSGRSKNMLNAAKNSKKYKIYKVITFTGFDKNNTLRKMGDINLWADSKSYNFVENTHQLWLLSLIDLLTK